MASDVPHIVEIDLKDVDTILEGLRGRHTEEDKVLSVTVNYPDLEKVLIHAGIILAATAWEIFIEENVRRLFTHRLQRAVSPTDIGNTFNSTVDAWFADIKPVAPNIALWAGDGWKNIIQEKFDKEVAVFNTPKTVEIKELSKRYTSIDFTKDWEWEGKSNEEACIELDAFMALRGAVVHTGQSQTGQTISKDELSAYRTFLERLAGVTASALTKRTIGA